MAEQESVYLFSTTALTNGSIDPSINFAEGQLPGTVNNSARGLMAAIARYVKDTDGSLTTAGSANAYTLTINGRQTPLATGHFLTFKASFANTSAATLAVTNADAVALGTKAIRGQGDVALGTGQMISGGVYHVRYDTAANSAAGAWILLNPASSLLAAGQLPGTATNDSATAGNIGEYIESPIASGSAVSIVTDVAKTITSISLTAGDWDVSLVGGVLPAGTTNTTIFFIGISLVNNTLDTTPGRLVSVAYGASGVVLGGNGSLASVPSARVSLSATTTVYFVAQSSFTVSTSSAFGNIHARRVR